MTKHRKLVEKMVKIVSIVLLVAASVIAWWFSYRSGLTITYNDAMSHLNIARFVIDSKQAGLAQLGSVWLPLNHILELTLIWNDWAWHSGFAGSFFSMLAYIFSAIGIYAIVDELTGSIVASIVGAAAFALNPNILYLQTTPLTEPLYLALVIASIYFLVKFIKTDDLKYLLISGVLGFLQVLARYDGWFVVFVEGLVIIYYLWVAKRASFHEIMAKFMLFAMPIVFAVILWLLWNALIFGSPLYFALGPYSAHAQQANIQAHSSLITKGSLSISLLAYWYAAVANVGLYLIIFSVLGTALFFLIRKKTLSFTTKFLTLVLLLSPVIFNILALYLGFSILNLPALHWNPSQTIAGEYFNVRYGIMALPFVAVFIGVLASFLKKIFVPLVALLIILQSLLIYHQGIITITDGTIGSSAFVDNDVAQILQQNVEPGQNILMSQSFFNAVSFKSGLPLKDFIYEGVSDEWTAALTEPQAYATWIVMANGDVGDPVYTELRERQDDNFLKSYKLFYAGQNADVYELRSTGELFVYAQGGDLVLGGGQGQYVADGVNSYDLAYKSKAAIDATFKNLSSVGVNTVRFWMFGDGNDDGFQPTAGIMNEARFENADYVIADAGKYNIRLIPVLLNNWTDYGGEQQYLKWIGENPADQDLFYSDPEALQLFENYVNHVVTRVNTVTGVPYADDPTIMAWEIVNEPRWSSADSGSFTQWFSSVATYIREKDPNHMITAETDTTSFNADKTLNIQDNCATLAVDLCTAHLYLYDGNGNITYTSPAQIQENVQKYIQLAKTDKKPFLLGEVGISKTTAPFGGSPLAMLKDVVGWNGESSGIFIWNWSDTPDTSYGFSPDGTKGLYTLANLSSVLGGKDPSTIYLAPHDASPDAGYDVSIPGAEQSSTATTSLAIAGTEFSAPENATTTIVLPFSSAPIDPDVTVITETPPSLSTPSLATTPLAPAPIPDKTIPYSPGQFSAADWGGGWGALTVTSDTLSIGSEPDGTSAETFLAGSSNWTDYIFTATVQWVKGQSFGLLARSDGNSNGNAILCEFKNDGQINIYRLWQGQGQFIGQGNTPPDLSTAHDLNVFAEVRDTHVTCGINGAIVASYLAPQLTSGSVGFKTWDPENGNSQIIVKQISVIATP